VPDNKPDGTSWNVIFGLSVTSQLIKKKPEPPQLEVAGKVTDKETGDPLGVSITFSGDTIKPIFSDPETGLYKVYLKKGGARIRASKKGYRGKERVVPPDSQGRVVIDFELSKKVSEEGVLAGVIKDLDTHKPVGANVTMIDLAGLTATSDLQTGIYKLTLPAGTHTVRVTAQNYRETVLPVVVVSGRTVIQNFSLKAEKVMKKGDRIILRGMVFASGSARIDPSSYSVLQTALETLKGNPTVKVEIGGHTDSVGSASSNMRLSLARANAVRNWLTNKGISPLRLVARGYGENVPIAPNTTRHGRSQNRRIEFAVLSK
jgi:outer membrane protein OmpA-like peptidoglycan-associated protein